MNNAENTGYTFVFKNMMIKQQLRVLESVETKRTETF